MNVASISAAPAAGLAPTVAEREQEKQVRETFNAAIGETLFAQMLKSMRKTVGKPAYFHGGRAEEAFQQQLDQVLAEKMSGACAGQFTGPMFDLLSLRRS